MAAPRGNQFWKLRSRHGRDRIFENSEDLWIVATEYFNWADAHPWYKIEQLKKPTPDPITGQLITLTKIPTVRPYTIQGFCNYIDCSLEWFYKQEERFKVLAEEGDKIAIDFLQIITRIRQIIYQQKLEGASVGAFNAIIISRELGMVDKKEHTGENGAPIKVQKEIKHTLEVKRCNDDRDKSGSDSKPGSEKK